MKPNPCPFCAPDPSRVFYRDALVIGLWDGFPVTPGHALIIPIRHIPGWFDTSLEERAALMRATDVARNAIEAQFGADAYNIGINSGKAAGQTIFHLHVHVIPRKHGDVADPRGGVRHVIPDKANYIRDSSSQAPYGAAQPISTQSLVTGGASDPLLPHLKRHLAAASAADIAVAFTMRSGLDLLQPDLQDLLDRRGRLRVLTGDYLGVTDPDALLRLLDLQGDIECRVYETAGGTAPDAFAGSFHPKAYLFQNRDGSGAAIVGSSNLSRSALAGGIEWNYRVLNSRDPVGLVEVRTAFDQLFNAPNSVSLSGEWVERYRARRPEARVKIANNLPDEPAPVIPSPHTIQQQALQMLAQTRKDGRRAGLVVLATGLGKTWLSAFDSMPFKRILFVAHRQEILGQALKTYRTIRPHDTLGFYTGLEKAPQVAVLFASIQTLSRQSHLDRFARDAFDYIVVDEFHHAEAQTYRRLLQHFKPSFLLGLTATPERSDGADLLSLCDSNLVYRCDVPEGIRSELLCPFRYFGVPDTVDYKNIPWRNKKFDENKLTEAVATQARAQNALDQYRSRGGKRTLAFCVSTRHADFMAQFLRDNGVSAAAVHSEPSSAPRTESLERLKDGSLSVLCAVDMFNEGVDVPELDTVMMLRPTESRIVWLQQFGRGLRRSDPDKRLTVIDYIGNHRAFLLKPQALFGLPSGDREILNIIERIEAGTAELPQGCEVTYELEVINILRSLIRTGGTGFDTLKRRYQDFRDTLGVRPTAVELFREGYNPRSVRPQVSSWLAFVKSEDGLSAEETQALDALQPFLEALETTQMVKSYKMVVLLAMLNHGQLPGSLSLDQLCDEVSTLARWDHHIAGDFDGAAQNSVELKNILRSNPIEAWVGGKGTGGVSYFEYVDGQFRLNCAVAPSVITPAQELIREIVDWRLAEYFARAGQTESKQYLLKVSQANGSPILFLPNRNTHPNLPEGWTEVRVNDQLLRANFVKIAINVLQFPGSEKNVLPETLRQWFGDDAGSPGTSQQVLLLPDSDSWQIRPTGSDAVGAVRFKRYRRADIPALYGLPYQERYWGQGFVRRGKHIFLFVTLDKRNHEAAFQYKDRFHSPTVFEWQSQNQTSRDGVVGLSICNHHAEGTTVHLFVRAKAKTREGKGESFLYCGQAEFVSWTGDKPITVIWKLATPVPEAIRNELSVPDALTAIE